MHFRATVLFLSFYETIFFLFLEHLANFLIGEGKLESFLEEFPPIDANISKARTGLTEAKRYLLSTASEQGKKVINLMYLFYPSAVICNYI